MSPSAVLRRSTGLSPWQIHTLGRFIALTSPVSHPHDGTLTVRASWIASFDLDQIIHQFAPNPRCQSGGGRMAAKFSKIFHNPPGLPLGTLSDFLHPRLLSYLAAYSSLSCEVEHGSGLLPLL
jgi:hypothetical protein